MPAFQCIGIEWGGLHSERGPVQLHNILKFLLHIMNHKDVGGIKNQENGPRHCSLIALQYHKVYLLMSSEMHEKISFLRKLLGHKRSGNRGIAKLNLGGHENGQTSNLGIKTFL